jgi:sugar phosphate isomerase/epimerase
MKFLATLCVLTAVLLVPPPAAAAPELGLQAWTFRRLTFVETLDQARALGLHHLQAYPGQVLGGGLAGTFTHTMDAGTLARILALAKARDVRIDISGVITPRDTAEWTALVAFAQSAGLREIVTEAGTDALTALAPTLGRSRLKISLHNHPAPSVYAQPETALAAVAGLDARFGLCADTGHWARTGLDPVAALRLARGRINSLHFKDVAERGTPSRDLPWGTGTSDTAGQLAELHRQKFDGVVYIEYEHESPALFAEVGRCVAYFLAAGKLSTEDLLRNRVVPAGFSADVRTVFAPGRGQDSARWPAPRPLFAADLSDAEMAYPGAWAFNAEGILAPAGEPGAKPNGDLWTRESYGDFVVTLEFRTRENSTSGVLLRSSDLINWLQNSLKIQIRQGDNAQAGPLVGAVCDLAAPARPVPIKPGEWYHYVITARGSLITVELEGEEVSKVDLDRWTVPGANPDGSPNLYTKAAKDLARSGRIGLQYDKSTVAFRNLFIERL